jgi:thiamine-phosphate pyrophosphorylase
MHSHLPLTEAVRRVVETASMLAEQEGHECEAADLLQALWLDESRGHEMLRACGIVADDLPSATGNAAGGELLLRDTLRRAERLANSPGSRGDVGTEHLLIALIEHDAAIAEWAAAHGVTGDQLRVRLSQSASAALGAIDTEVRLRSVDISPTEAVVTDRLLDAAANRAREALRVLEDVARFILNDAVLSQELKGLRHGLQQTIAKLANHRPLLARDTIGDVGTAISLPSEMTRGSLLSLVRSNAARAQEALRSLEELAKLTDSELAGRFEQLRYRTYTIEAVLGRRFLITPRLESARLCLLVTDSLCKQAIGKVVREACAAGVDIVQLREKSMSDARLRELAGYVREWTAEAGVLFVVNDRPDIAALVGADGVHVGQEDLSVAEARRIVGGDKLVGVSTHTVEQLRRAALEGADYLGVGPVFASPTKTFESLAGLEFVREAAAETSLPWFGIGGINAANVEQFYGAGGRRIAVSSAICGSGNVGETTRQLRAELEAKNPNQPFASSSIRSAP